MAVSSYKKRIMITLPAPMVDFIDDVVKRTNESAPSKDLTRGRFVALCILNFIEERRSLEELKKGVN